MPDSPSVLVLGGGPDAERDVSLNSARLAAAALERAGFAVHRRTIERLTIDELLAMPGDVIFPLLHGGWGEGGQLQDLMESDGRPFVGSASRASRWAMDKIATKFAAQSLAIPTPAAHILDLRDPVCPLPLPVVIKPVHEGSTIGLFVCRCAEEWAEARQQIDEDRAGGAGAERAYMIEPCIGDAAGGGRARELTVGLLDNSALPIIEIVPAEGLYDYEAKYTRDDTRYLLDPALPSGVADLIRKQTEDLARAMGVRHVARTDFMLDPATGRAWFLEINTLPGFTDHSLVPMAARHMGVDMPTLCRRLVHMALRDHDAPARPPARPQRVQAPRAAQ